MTSEAPTAPQHKMLCHPSKEIHMAWQKPQATDLRYGFEITMYISAR